MELPEQVLRLFRELNFGVVVTRRADGTPHSTPVWVDTDGEHVMFNTHTRRAKYRHLRDDPWVAVTVLEHADPQRVYATVYGRVARFDWVNADAHLDKMARKYLGIAYPAEWRAAEAERVIVIIEPERLDYFERDAIPSNPLAG